MLNNGQYILLKNYLIDFFKNTNLIKTLDTFLEEYDNEILKSNNKCKFS